MVIAYDLKVEDSNDFIFKNGDFVVVDSNQQHSVAIMESNKGEWKMNPFLGVDINRYLNGNGVLTGTILEQEVRRQFKNDGFKTQDLEVDVDISTNKVILSTNAIRLR
jgi:hypothetical protein